jgi:hypothetical protein
MAEPKHTTPATNDDTNSPAADVPQIGADQSAREGFSGRTDVNMQSTIVAAHQPTSTAAALWRIAVSEYEQADAQFEANWAAYEAAGKLIEDSEPSRRLMELEHTYGISRHESKASALERIDIVIQHRDYPDSCAHCGKGKDIPDAEIDRMADEAENIHGEFVGLQAALSILKERHLTPANDEHTRFTHEAFYPARDKLLATPALDIAAVLFKAEVLATAVDGAEGLRDDLTRLFGSK